MLQAAFHHVLFLYLESKKEAEDFVRRNIVQGLFLITLCYILFVYKMYFISLQIQV